MKFTILFALLPLLASAAPAAPEASQLGPSISQPQANEQALDSWAQHRADNIKNGINPNNMDAPPAVYAGKQIGHFYKRAIKETYYVDLFDKSYMWVNVEDTTAGTSKWEHRQMLTSGGPTYSSAAPSSTVTAVKSSSSSAAKPSSSAAKSSSSVSSASKAAAVASSSSKAAVSSSSSKAAVASSSSKAAVSSSSSKAAVASSSSKAAVSSSSSKAAVSSSVSKAAVSSSSSKAAVSSSASKAAVSSAAPASSTSKVAAVASSSASKPVSSSVSSAAAASATGGVSAADQAQFVTLHNDFRAKYTAGKVTWDDTLAAFALKTAQTCKYGHTGGPYGENIAAGVGGGYNITKAFNSWANEDALYNFTKPGYSSATGHFTQIVWKGTTKIGCAAASCADGTIFTGYRANSTYVVCEYQTPGNIVSSDPNRTAQIFTANVGPKA